MKQGRFECQGGGALQAIVGVFKQTIPQIRFRIMFHMVNWGSEASPGLMDRKKAHFEYYINRTVERTSQTKQESVPL